MRNLRRSVLAIAAVAIAVVLTACGAVIDTTMTVNGDGTGSRVITLKLPADDMKNLKSDAATIDASIAKNLPAELSYSGLAATTDGGLTTTFTLDFATPGEYEKKAKSLVASGGNDSADVEFTIADSFVIKGITFSENYTSYSLVKWMFDGLIADGVIASSDAGNTYEMGANTLIVDGATDTSSSSYFDYSDVVDNGFASVEMATNVADTEAITRTITYYAGYASTDIYDEYFEANTPDGSTLKEDPSGVWTLTFTGDETAVSEFTDVALGADGSTLVISSTPLEGDPATVMTSVVDEARCDAVCSPGGGTFTDTVTAAPGSTPNIEYVDVTAGETTAFQISPPIASTNTKLSFGTFGGASAELDFVVDNSEVAKVGDGFKSLFTPPKDVGTLDVGEGDDQTTYTARVTADSANELAMKLSSWLSGAQMTVAEGPGTNLFWTDSYYALQLPLMDVTGSHSVTKATTEIALPFGQTGIRGGKVAGDGTGFIPVFASKGPTAAALTTFAALILILLAGIAVLIRFRRHAQVIAGRLRPHAKNAFDVSTSRARASLAGIAGTSSPLFDMPSRDTRTSTFGGLLAARAVTAAVSPRPSVLNLPHVPRPTAQYGSVLSVPPAPTRRAAAGSLFELTAQQGL